MFFCFSSLLLCKKRSQLFLTATCLSILSFSLITANAQVNVNESALNNLGSGQEKKHIEAHKKTKTTKQSSRKTHRKDEESQNITSANKKNQTNVVNKPTVIPTIPHAPPPVPVFKDADIIVPLHPPAPPAMPKVNNQAKGKVISTKKHTLLIFDTNSVDLNETMLKAIMDYANILKQHPNSTVYLNAYSHGNSDDLSTPRRTALNRGLAVRAVLINQGIPSTRIYLLAKGVPQTLLKDLSPDHVEMIRSDLMTRNKTQILNKK